MPPYIFKKSLYSTYVLNFIPIGACLVLFDCPNLLPTFGPDFLPLLTAFITSQCLHGHR